MNNFLKHLPKAELHLHIEGTMEPELMFELAERNKVRLPYDSVEAVRAAYEFDDLQSFLDLYYRGMDVLRQAEDFFDLAMDYFRRAQADGVVHVDLSFDPQAHLARGIDFDIQMEGLQKAMKTAESELDVSSSLILSFLRDKPVDEAMAVLEQARPFLNHISAVGLDSAEQGHPPAPFAPVFARARELGIPGVAHAGEEGPADYIWQALDSLRIIRVDHGVRCMEDPQLVMRLREEQIPLTVCPLSNVRLKVVERMLDHPLPAMLRADLKLTINSDDPAYFGGGLLANYQACHEAFGWDEEVFQQLAKNALEEAFMNPARRTDLIKRLGL